MYLSTALEFKTGLITCPSGSSVRDIERTFSERSESAFFLSRGKNVVSKCFAISKLIFQTTEKDLTCDRQSVLPTLEPMFFSSFRKSVTRSKSVMLMRGYNG
jgi:hypothetical protein